MNISDDQYEVLSGLFGCRPRQLYGMTETIPAVLTDEQRRPAAVEHGLRHAGLRRRGARWRRIVDRARRGR